LISVAATRDPIVRRGWAGPDSPSQLSRRLDTHPAAAPPRLSLRLRRRLGTHPAAPPPRLSLRLRRRLGTHPAATPPRLSLRLRRRLGTHPAATPPRLSVAAAPAVGYSSCGYAAPIVCCGWAGRWVLILRLRRPDVRRGSASPFAGVRETGLRPAFGLRPKRWARGRTWGVAPIVSWPYGEAEPRLTSGRRSRDAESGRAEPRRRIGRRSRDAESGGGAATQNRGGRSRGAESGGGAATHNRAA